MKIIEASAKFNARQAYLLTRNPESRNMKEMVGETVKVAEWCLFSDIQEGEEKEILSIHDGGGNYFATNSPTFQREFKFIVDLCEEYGEPLSDIRIVGGKSKSDRDFVTCMMA